MKINILKSLSHPNIIKFRASCKNPKRNMHILMEYADGGDLEKVIKNAQGQYISEKKILGWLFQICSAINYIHNNKIIHRDIKASNIFLTRRGDIKLGDFGISRILEETLEKVQSWLGTPYYVSPQIINRESYTNKTDIWSLGVLLYRLCALKYPFEGTDYFQLIIRGRYQPIPDQYSNHLKSLIENMLQIDESRRPTAQQILDSIENRLTKYQSELKLQQLQQQQQQHLDQLFQNDNRMVNYKEDLPLFPRLPFLWAPLRHQIIQTPQQKHPLGMANGYQHRIEQKIASDRAQNKILRKVFFLTLFYALQFIYQLNQI